MPCPLARPGYTVACRLDESVAVRVRRRLDAVRRAGLGEDARDVLGHGIRADHQLIGDLLVAAACGEEAEDLGFPPGEAVLSRCAGSRLPSGLLGLGRESGDGGGGLSGIAVWALTVYRHEARATDGRRKPGGLRGGQEHGFPWVDDQRRDIE